MSATSTADPSPGAAGEPGAATCAFCGAHLDPEQEWCLECGIARTIVHRPPDWRIPLAVVGVIVIAAVVGFVVVLANLNDGGRPAGPPRPSAPTTQATQSPPAATGAIQSWPAGLSGWTVFLATEPTQSAAMATARQLNAGGIPVGVIDSSQHPRLAPGQWIVFSGRYATRTGAQAAAATLVAKGYPTASAKEVAPPGGI